jgi:hypothetical protein
MAHHQSAVRAGLAAVLLAGCARGAYVAPDGPGTARLTIQNASADVLPLDTFEDQAECSGRLALDRGGVPAGDVWTVRIAAGEPFTLTARGSAPGGMNSCSAAVTFDPVAGESYLAIYRMRGDKCFLQLGRRTSDRYAAKTSYAIEPSARPRDEPACR